MTRRSRARVAREVRARTKQQAAKPARLASPAVAAGPERPRCRYGYADMCCLPGAWERVGALGEMGFRTYGEPLPPEVIDTAVAEGLDPHDLDDHVEGRHGWEPHNTGYAQAVVGAAACMKTGECEGSS